MISRGIFSDSFRKFFIYLEVRQSLINDVLRVFSNSLYFMI